MMTSRIENDLIRLEINHQLGCIIESMQIQRDGRWVDFLTPTSNGSGGGSFIMVPWSNRIKDARFSIGDRRYQLESNNADRSAIHGIGRCFGWSILDRSPYSMRCVFDSRTRGDQPEGAKTNPGFPFEFGSVYRIEISDVGGIARVRFDLETTNLSEEVMPCGMGFHPYFQRSLFDKGDDLRIKALVDGRYPCENQIPIGPMSRDEVCERFAQGEPIGNPDLDDVFGGLKNPLQLRWDKSGVECTIESSASLNHLVVYTPKTQSGDPESFVCVEPTSMVNDGFNLHDAGHVGAGVKMLGPGETMSVSMEWRIGMD